MRCEPIRFKSPELIGDGALVAIDDHRQRGGFTGQFTIGLASGGGLYRDFSKIQSFDTVGRSLEKFLLADRSSINTGNRHVVGDSGVSRSHRTKFDLDTSMNRTVSAGRHRS